MQRLLEVHRHAQIATEEDLEVLLIAVGGKIFADVNVELQRYETLTAEFDLGLLLDVSHLIHVLAGAQCLLRWGTGDGDVLDVDLVVLDDGVQ